MRHREVTVEDGERDKVAAFIPDVDLETGIRHAAQEPLQSTRVQEMGAARAGAQPADEREQRLEIVLADERARLREPLHAIPAGGSPAFPRGPGRIRTCDQQIMSPPLWTTELRALEVMAPASLSQQHRAAAGRGRMNRRAMTPILDSMERARRRPPVEIFAPRDAE